LTEFSQNNSCRVLLTAAAVVVIIAGLRAAEAIMVPFLLAAFIAVISAPFLFWLRSQRLPMWVALPLVILIIFTGGLLVGVLIGTSLADFTSALPDYQVRLQRLFVGLLARFEVEGQITTRMLLEYIDPGAAMQLTSRIFTALTAMLSNGFLILLTVVFILLEASGFPAKLRASLGDPQAPLTHFEQIVANINRYMKIKTVVSLLTGIIIALWLMLLGVDYPLLWGVLAFFLNYVPSIGSIIAAIPAVLLALVQLGSSSALLTVAGYLAVNIVLGNIIEPRFMGRGLGLSTLVVFMSLVFWGWVWGPVGMLLAVPLTMLVKIALASSEETRHIAILLGSEQTADYQGNVSSDL
jgi:AI-2 transport protein TqsA